MAHAKHPKLNASKRWVLFALLVILIVVWAVGLASGQSVNLRAASELDPRDVDAAGGITVAMVADVEGLGDAETEALNGLVIVSREAMETRVSLDDLQDALRRAGVNLGLLSVRGFAACELRVGLPTTEAEPAIQLASPVHSATTIDVLTDQLDPNDITATATPTHPIDLEQAPTLQALIKTKLRQGLRLPAEELVLRFDGRHADTLRRSTLGASYTVEPIGDVRLGRMSVRVEHTAGLGETFRETIGVRVGWKTRVVVATRDIAPHERLTESNLALADVTIDRLLDGELFDLDAARGAVASSSLRTGERVRQKDLGQPVLVKRGQHVTVQVTGGGFAMTMTGYAEHDAALHEPVTIRSEARRTRDGRTFRAYVSGPGRVTTSPVSPAKQADSPSLARVEAAG
ncbi:MAG: flagellar basal body P-ring formation chaperone FlgA [Planctomycetota bacterium]